MLKENGVVIENVISSIDGDTGDYLATQYNAFKKIFGTVYIYPYSSEKKSNGILLNSIRHLNGW